MTGEVNQPYSGTTFTSHGHYGSTIFDPMSGIFLELNICDDCLYEVAQKKAILVAEPAPRPTPEYKVWEPRGR